MKNETIRPSEFHRRACPACRSTELKEEVTSDKRAERMKLHDLKSYWSGFHEEKVIFTYARCDSCGLLYCPRFFNREQLVELYSALAPNMDLVQESALKATQASYWRSAAHLKLPRGDYLELGPDVGHVAAHAAASGQFDRFWLIEPNRDVHGALASSVGNSLSTISADMDDLSIVPDASVALAVMVHVLDHLLEPLDILQHLQGKLVPGGALVIVTHNEQSLLRRVMGKKFPPFCLQHPELYNPASMTMLLNRAGFDDIRVERSKNYFPLNFLVGQALSAAGVKLGKLPIPSINLGLKLGNMLTIARKPTAPH